MPTIKPRVQVTLEPQTHEVIQRLAFLQGRTRGAVISDLLEAVGPALGRTVALLEAAAAAPDKIKDGLRAVINSTHDDLVAAGGEGTKQLDFILDQLTNGAGSTGVDPHVVTRGSGITPHAEEAAPKRPYKPRKPRGSTE
jgi:hypothetical protein